MQNKSPRKHVIFLGAGASFTSGYPLANGLRLRLSNERQLIFDLEELAKVTKESVDFEERKICRDYFTQFKDALEQFRHGGFGSVDEFSKLASRKYPEFVQEMKQLMRLALSLHNPEWMFEQSDYYPFIQRLFSDEALPSLKHNITVLSFNYDCYLDHLLLKAQCYRNRLGGLDEPTDGLKNRLTSGFFKPSDLSGLQDCTQQFRYFKLHGSIAYADGEAHKELFVAPIRKRLDAFKYKRPISPIAFPWEIFDEDGKFIGQEKFIFVKEAEDDKQKENGVILYKLYKTIWEGAREAVQNAYKISFVGLSMHPYLNHGLRFLFDGREHITEFVVANKANEGFKNAKNRLHPASLCGRVAEVLKNIAPKMKHVQSSSEYDGNVSMDVFEKEADYDITPRYSFAEFIERELD